MSPKPSKFAKKVPEDALLRGFYREMLRIRLVEERIADRYHEEKMRCPVHLSIGQEAVAVGTAAALRKSDLIVSTHRAHAHYLAKGGNLTAMISEILGKATGCSGGRGGSMNLTDAEAGVVVTLPIVGSSIPIGVGLALAEKQRGGKGVIGVYLGDAALEEGVFHEAANFAALKSLPVVFFCENNLYSVYTNLAERQPQRPIPDLAVGHGMRAWGVDGNDVRKIYDSAVEAVGHTRGGGGPSFLVFDTYRWREHCGPNYDNDIGYRTVEEFEAWRARSPNETFAGEMLALGLLDQPAMQAMEKEIAGEIDAAFSEAEAAPFPSENDAEAFVYVE